MEALIPHFPRLSPDQIELYQQLEKHIRDWNEKINVISRKDIDNLFERHILHSLSICKYVQFSEGSRVLDLGTGGGFPGLPLAIFFPQVHFTLIDGTRKKIGVVNDIITQLNLQNVVAKQVRAEEMKEKFDFIVTRAVAPADKIWLWAQRLIELKHLNAIPNGIILLKGGNVSSEIKSLPKGTYAEVIPLDEYFDIAHFHEKYLIYIQG